MNDQTEISSLPEEIILKILSYLSPYYEYYNGQLVCRKWYRIIKSMKKLKQREFRNALLNGNLSYTKVSGNDRPINSRQGRTSTVMRGIRRGGVTQNNKEPSPRFSHSVCTMGNKMFVFGGCSLMNSAFNDLYQFDLLTRKWQRIIINQGFMPAPRECSSIVSFEEKLVLFGGWCSPRSSDVTAVPKFFNDTYLIDVENKSCSVISCAEKETPGTRAGHNACISGDKMIVFGGAQRILRYDDVWFLDMEALCWYCPCINGKKPEGRFGHSQFAVGETHVIIIGGCGGSNSLYDDAWLLDTNTWFWYEINVENKLWQAPNLWCHSAVKIGDLIVTFSDQTICNNCLGLQSNPLESSLFSGPVPVPSSTCIKCADRKVKRENFDSQFQMYSLDCSRLLSFWTISWRNSTSIVPQMISRARSLFTIAAGRAEIFIFGGVYNSEKLKMTNSPPSNVIIISAKS